MNCPDQPLAGLRVRIQHCGVCHSNSFAKDGLFSAIVASWNELMGQIDSKSAALRKAG